MNYTDTYEHKMFIYYLEHNITAREYFSALKQATNTTIASRAILAATDEDYKTALEILTNRDYHYARSRTH